MNKFNKWIQNYIKDNSGLVEFWNTNDMVNAYNEGNEARRKEILDIIRPCLVRDNTLQKLIRQIEELK